MTTDRMPLLLDDNAMNGLNGAMAVDLDGVDLFGDPVPADHVAIALPISPPSKQLQQRVDELRSRGCCQLVVLPVT